MRAIMHAFQMFPKDAFEAAREARLITIREDGAGLRILNYSDSALYTPGAWDNPAVRACRGLIVDEDWNVIARPWAKFFNYGQAEAGELDLNAAVEVTDKLDGSLGIIHYDANGVARVASRGSFESDQAIHATATLCRYFVNNLDVVTPLVEIIYPANRIVCDYGDRDELVLLGGVVIETGEYLGPRDAAAATNWTGPSVQTFEYQTLRDAIAADPRPGMEGLCARRLDTSHIVKIKQEEYVRLHRIVTGLSERTVWEHMSEGKALEDMLGNLPDELHDWTRSVWASLEAGVTRLYLDTEGTHAEIVEDLPDGWTRKEYALAAQQHPAVRPYLFQLLDGRDPRPSILRTLKPAGETRAKAISEAVA